MGNVYNTGDTPIYEKTANKDQASGYMGLDGSGRGSDPPKLVTNADVSTSAAISKAKVSSLWKPTGAIAETFSRLPYLNTGAPAASAQLMMTAIELPGSTVISNISFFTGGTGLVQGQPTNQWFAIADSSRNKLAFTVDDTTTVWTGNTEKKLWIARTVTDGAITSGLATLTSATAAFTNADVGKQVTVIGAGAAGAPLGTTATPVTISSVTNATTAVLSANAGTTVASGGTVYIATPYTTTSTDPQACYLVYLVKDATAMGTVVIGAGALANGAPVSTSPAIWGTSTGSLTTPASWNSQGSAFNVNTFPMYGYAS